VRITIQYFEGCPHWKIADERVKGVLRRLGREDVTVDHQLIDSPETAERVGFHGSPTILIDGRDPFATGREQIGMACRVYRTDSGAQFAPTEAELLRQLTRVDQEDSSRTAL
jgi:hypothetical protein